MAVTNRLSPNSLIQDVQSSLSPKWSETFQLDDQFYHLLTKYRTICQLDASLLNEKPIDLPNYAEMQLIDQLHPQSSIESLTQSWLKRGDYRLQDIHSFLTYMVVKESRCKIITHKTTVMHTVNNQIAFMNILILIGLFTYFLMNCTYLNVFMFL